MTDMMTGGKGRPSDHQTTRHTRVRPGVVEARRSLGTHAMNQMQLDQLFETQPQINCNTLPLSLCSALSISLFLCVELSRVMMMALVTMEDAW